MNFENLDFEKLEDREKVIGRKPHCEQDYGGSHYHCGRCDKISSMMGHMTVFCKHTGDRTLHHFCCSDNCQLNNIEEIEDELNLWLRLEKENGKDYGYVLADIQKKLNYARKRHEG